MVRPESDVTRALAWPTYFVAFLLVATPALDYVTNVWPLRFGDVLWRYGSVGLFAGFALTPLFGIMFALAAAIVLRHRRVLRGLSILNVAMAPLLILLILFFVLDVLQVRGTVPQETQSTFDVGAVKAAIKCLTTAAALAWLGIAGVRATRSDKQGKRHRGEHGEVQLVRSERAVTSSALEEGSDGQ